MIPECLRACCIAYPAALIHQEQPLFSCFNDAISAAGSSHYYYNRELFPAGVQQVHPDYPILFYLGGYIQV